MHFHSSQAANFSIKTVKSKAKKAFTLSEVLIVIGIIGIVAEMTIPQLIQTTQDAEYKTGKDEVRMSIAEAGRILSVTDSISGASSAEDFVKHYLSKQLKIAKYCAPEDMEQCGMPSGNPTKFKDLNNVYVASMPKTWTTITTPYGVAGNAPAADGSFAPMSATNPTTTNFNNSYVFLAANGIAVNLFYNPNCAANFQDKMYYNKSYTYTDRRNQFSLDTACMSGVYDMNGLKKPNQVGRDIGFFGVFYNGIQSTSASVLPKVSVDDTYYKWNQADAYCRGIKGYKLPTEDELSALFLGRNITGISSSGYGVWSGSRLPGIGYIWAVYFDTGGRHWWDRSNYYKVRCVRD